MKKEINFVVRCYTEHNELHWKKLFPLSTIETFLPIWCIIPTETISIYTYYKDAHLGAMPSAVDIDMKKLSVTYQVALVANNKEYENTKVTYSCLDDLLCSVLNYLATTQETTMTYKDILTSEKIKWQLPLS